MSIYEGVTRNRTTPADDARSVGAATEAEASGKRADAAHPRLLSLKIEAAAMAVCMAGIALITAVNVVTRYLTNISLAFTEEYSVALMVITAMIGTSYAMARRRHISIDYFIDKLAPRRRHIADLIALGATGVCFLILLVYGAQLAWDEYRYGVLTPGLGYPSWVFTMWMPTLSALVLIRVAERIWHLIAGSNRPWHG